MGDIRPLPDVDALTVPLQAIDAGVEDVEITRMRKAGLPGPAVDAFEDTAVRDDGDLAMTVGSPFANDSADCADRTPGELTHGFGNAFAGRVARIEFARLPCCKVFRIALLDIVVLQTLKPAVATLAQSRIDLHRLALQCRHGLRRIARALQVAGIDGIQRFVLKHAPERCCLPLPFGVQGNVDVALQPLVYVQSVSPWRISRISSMSLFFYLFTWRGDSSADQRRVQCIRTGDTGLRQHVAL